MKIFGLLFKTDNYGNKKGKKGRLQSTQLQNFYFLYIDINIVFSCFKAIFSPKCLVKEYYFHLVVKSICLDQRTLLLFPDW